MCQGKRRQTRIFCSFFGVKSDCTIYESTLTLGGDDNHDNINDIYIFYSPILFTHNKNGYPGKCSHPSQLENSCAQDWPHTLSSFVRDVQMHQMPTGTWDRVIPLGRGEGWAY
jgi:hypothetical protein